MTNTIGLSMSASHSGVGAGGSKSHGPINSTEAPQSGCGYSNGSPVATSISGARLSNSSALRTALAPAVSRTMFTGFSIALFSAPVRMGRSASSRSRPSRPGRGRIPGPNGGTPRDRRNGVKGQNDSQGTEPASAAAAAPQQFASMMSTSGRTWAIRPRRSSTSYAARRPNTPNADFNAARLFVSIQSLITAASIRWSIADDSKPRSRAADTPSARVRSTMRCPRR